MSQAASLETRKSALFKPTRPSSEVTREMDRAIFPASASPMSTGPAAPPYRNGEPGVGEVHCTLRPIISAVLPFATNSAEMFRPVTRR